MCPHRNHCQFCCSTIEVNVCVPAAIVGFIYNGWSITIIQPKKNTIIVIKNVLHLHCKM